MPSIARLTLLLFFGLQAADGLLTYAAITILGPGAEGNPILTTWFLVAGVGPTLLVAKLVACGGGVWLYLCGVRRTLAVLTILYFVAAIVPWLYFLNSV